MIRFILRMIFRPDFALEKNSNKWIWFNINKTTHEVTNEIFKK